MNVFEESADSANISGPPTKADYLLDRSFRGLATVCAWLILLVVGLLLWEIGTKAVPAIREYSLGFLAGTTWDVNNKVFGILQQLGHTVQFGLSLGHRWFFRCQHGDFPHPGFSPSPDSANFPHHC